MKNPNNLTYYIYVDHAGEWRWWLAAANNRSIAVSGEGYKNEADCIYAINLVASSDGAPIKRHR